MECKILEKEDIELMKNFVDDQNTKYDEEDLLTFINEKNAYGFIIKNENNILGFSYGYVLVRPDEKKDFYLHAIDIMDEYQSNGYGTKLMIFINEYIKEIGCRKMFLFTNKSNVSACKCYENAGGKSKTDDDIVYVFL